MAAQNGSCGRGWLAPPLLFWTHKEANGAAIVCGVANAKADNSACKATP
jgi:hypothetical protein